MIDQRSGYKNITVDANIRIDGGVMPARDIADDGSWKVLRGEDLAFLKEASEQRRLYPVHFTDQTKQILASDHVGLFANLKFAGRVAKDASLFASYYNSGTLSSSDWQHPVYVNPDPTLYFNFGTIPNATAEANDGGYSLFKYLLQHALSIADPGVTPAMGWDGVDATLRPPASDFHSLVADNVRKEFYYMQPLTRCLLAPRGSVCNLLYGSLNATTEWSRLDGRDLDPPVPATSDSGTLAANGISYAQVLFPVGAGTVAYSTYRSGGKYHAYRDYRAGFVGNVDVRLPFPVKGYAVIHVFKGEHTSPGASTAVVKYGFWSQGVRQMSGSREDRHVINLSRNYSDAGGGRLSINGLLWFAENVFSYKTSWSQCSVREGYDVWLHDSFIVCDMDLTAETNSLNWNWSPA